LPLLLLITLLAGGLLWDGVLSRVEAIGLLAGFFALIGWTVYAGLRERQDTLAAEMDQELAAHPMPLSRALFWLAVGLVLLIVSSRILVWGAVSVAQALGVSDLIIGLTIVALGTSLPELAASVIAARKGEHDIAIGNVVGSNMFNLLAVVGIAGVIAPMPDVAAEVLSRDWATMLGLTVLLFAMAYGFRGQGRINRPEGLLLLLAYVAYTGYLVLEATGAIA
jgi:cation:H+ antiporter